MTKEIIFVGAPLCPKCVRIKRWLKEIEETKPEIKIKRFNIAFDFGKVKQFNLKTIPSVIVGNKQLGGWIKEEEFWSAVEQL